MIKDEEIERYYLDLNDGEYKIGLKGGLRVMRQLYQDLISQGKLREVKTVEYDLEEGCLGCGWPNDNIYPFSKCCPGCGNEVKWLDPKPIKR